MSQAYADPNCPDCGGMGFIYGASMLDGGHSCHCMMDALKLQNMEKIWPSLSRAKTFDKLREDPPLKYLLRHNAWITGKMAYFRAHLKALAFTQDPMWDARVFTDLDIVETWLKTAKAQGHKIYDSEVDNHSNEFIAMDIAELVIPYDLIILKLGVKQAPNKETHSTLLEALAIRQHLGKPVWIVDQPDQPILDDFHKAYSERLENILHHWTHVELVGPRVQVISRATQEDFDYDVVAASQDVDDILEVPEEAASAVNDALSDLTEEEVEEETEADAQAEEEDEEEAEEEEGDEEEEDLDPMLEALRRNEERAAQEERYGKKKKRRSNWSRRKKGGS